MKKTYLYPDGKNYNKKPRDGEIFDFWFEKSYKIHVQRYMWDDFKKEWFKIQETVL